MTMKSYCMIAATILGVAGLSGCADSGNTLTTGALNAANGKVVKTAQTLDPACISLAAKIDGLRKEGTMARLAKVASGTTRSTMVKRASLRKAAELDVANTQFQARCSTYRPTSAAATIPVPVVAKKAVKAKVATAAKKVAANKIVKKATTAATGVAKQAAQKAAVNAATSAATAAIKKK